MNLLSMLDRPIAYHRIFVDIAGSVAGAVFLSQLVYWSKRTTLVNGWLYKTQTEWEEETGLGRYEQESARRALRDAGVLAEIKRGIPCQLHFRLDTTKLASLLNPANLNDGNQQASVLETSKQACGFTAGKHAGKSQSNTEITHIFSENTSDIPTTSGDGIDQSDNSEKHKPENQNQSCKTANISESQVFPNVEDRALIKDWYAHRKNKRALVSQTVIDGIVREAGIAGFTIEQALRTSIDRNWVGFKAEWCTSVKGGGQSSQHQINSFDRHLIVPGKNYREGLGKDGHFDLSIGGK